MKRLVIETEKLKANIELIKKKADGRIIYGVGCGVITVLIRYFGSYPEGVSFSILIMNMLVWYLDRATLPRRFGGKTNGK